MGCRKPKLENHYTYCADCAEMRYQVYRAQRAKTGLIKHADKFQQKAPYAYMDDVCRVTEILREKGWSFEEIHSWLQDRGWDLHSYSGLKAGYRRRVRSSAR